MRPSLPPTMRLLRQLARGGLVVGTGTLAWRLGNFASLFLVARGVGATAGGTAAIPLIATAMAYGTIANLAVGTYVGRFLLRRNRRTRPGAHLSNVAVLTIGATLAGSGVLAEVVRRSIDLPVASPAAAWLVAFACILGFAAADVAITILNIVGAHRPAATVQVLFGLLSLAVCAAGRSLPGPIFVLLYPVVPLALLGVALVQLRLIAGPSPAPRPRPRHLGRVANSMLRFSLPLLVSNACINPLVVWLLTSLDETATSRAASLIAYTWMGACAAIPGFLNTTSQAVVFGRRGGTRTDLFVAMLGLNVGIALAAAAGVAMLSGLVLRLYGPLGAEMTPVFTAFIAAAVPFAAFQVVATHVMATGRPGLVLQANIVFAAALVLALRTGGLAAMLGDSAVGAGFLLAHLVRTASLCALAWRAGLLLPRPRTVVGSDLRYG